MHIPRLYINQEDLEVGELHLSQSCLHHCVNVLRVKTADPVIIFNGLGGEYHGHFIEVSKKKAIVQLESFLADDNPSTCQLHLIQGVSRKDRMHTAIQKAVELGVSEITPLFTEFSDLKKNAELLKKKQQQWQAVVINACEQCGQNVLPKLHPIQHFEPWLENFDGSGNLNLAFTLLHEGQHLKTFDGQDKTICCAIGPEGGFSEAEEQQLLNNNFQAATLGRRILRFETAAMAACAIAQYEWGKL